MKKNLLTYCMLGLALLSFSCDDKDADDVVPQLELSMERTFVYHDNHETKEATYATADLQSGFHIENEQLNIYIDSGKDEISFKIAEADLVDGYVGAYTIMSLPDPANRKANTTYAYRPTTGSGSIYFSSANFMSGSVNITSYNEKHNLVSGNIELTMEDVPDPTITSPTSTPRRCDVTVTGTFKNAKLTSNP